MFFFVMLEIPKNTPVGNVPTHSGKNIMKSKSNINYKYASITPKCICILLVSLQFKTYFFISLIYTL